ncbi:hypothetical protein P7H31_12115 [Enterococcus asini]|nr:hypothetical protein [Enterococcus asini]MDT2765037.1 hypothetical protein [Enterococcus asini]
MNLFGDSDYLEKLSLKGDPLERLEKVVVFECFRPTLNGSVAKFENQTSPL